MKRRKTLDLRVGGHQSRGRCSKCGRTHEGSFRERRRGCFNCGQLGNFSKDCPRGLVPMCFLYNQVGHKKADTPTLMIGAVRTPAPTTLRITYDRKGRVEALAVRSRTLQLQAGETIVSSNAIAGTFNFHFLHHIIYLYICFWVMHM